MIHRLFRPLRTSVAAGVLAVGLGACTGLDPYAQPFARISVGDPRNQVEAALGAPDFTGRIEIPVAGPLLRLDTGAWKCWRSNKTYLVFYVLDHTVAKAIIA